MHEEKVELRADKIASVELEQRLKSFGWKNLNWVSVDSAGNTRNPLARRALFGLPPNYTGKYEDYSEQVLYTLHVSEKPWKESGTIVVRNYLSGPVLEGPENIAWKK